MEIKITMMEAYVIFKAVESRHQYVTDDFEAPQEELEFLQSVYDKMKMLKVDLVIINSETSHNNQKIQSAIKSKVYDNAFIRLYQKAD